MPDIHSSFTLQDNGAIRITLDDPTFVRAETVLVDMESGEVHALLQQKLHSLGAAPANIMRAFSENSDVMLSATRIDGSSLVLRSHVVIWH
ncbi:MAG: hypothetical protein JNL76_06065 [Alphaproteobacteria bacterium]|nr:hypothetical protein [Alphaproteobacteria bacterium]